MNILILFSVIFGVTLAQAIKDCDHGINGASGRHSHHQDIYQRPSDYDSDDYTPHTSYGPPDPPRRNNYPQDSSDGESNARPTYSQNVNRPAPVYGPPPSRPRVAAAAGIYDDYEDILYAQPPATSRRYNLNYAQREPYYPRYETYPTIRRPEYRVPVYYAPLIPDGFIPVHSHSPTTGKPTIATGTPSSTSETYQSEHQHGSASTSSSSSSSTEQENYDDGQVRRQQPTVVVAGTTSPIQNELKRYLFRKPFRGIRKLFQGSILAKRNKIGLIPSFIQGATSNF